MWSVNAATGGKGLSEGKERDLGKGLKIKSDDEQLRGLEGLRLEKRRLRGDFLTLYNALTEGGAARWGSGSAPWQHWTGQDEMASSCPGGDLDWVLGKTFTSEKGCQGCPWN